jgi:N,N'-diacetyllegionaminate synthase
LRLQLGDNRIGDRIFVLAEIGNNHNGDFQTAKSLVEEAVDAGADGVKFQTFNPDLYVERNLPTPPHVQGIHKTQYERLKSIQLTRSEYYSLRELADARGIIFSSTPFDIESVDFLNDLVPFFKIASGDLTNIPLMEHVATKDKPVVLSTGMANDSEIQNAVDIFDRDKLILLHCVALYPTPIEQANVLGITYLQEKFGLPVGHSDHMIGIGACKVAASLGAVFLEKHFTLDKDQPIGDHKLSSDPKELAQLVQEVREIELMRGIYGKPVDNQKESSMILRRGLYARESIKKGEPFRSDNVVALRPPVGILAENIDQVLSGVAAVDIKKDASLTLEMIAEN